MSILKKVLYLCAKNGISINELERDLGFPNESLRSWGRIIPSVDQVNKVAVYFEVSTDFLINKGVTLIKEKNYI